MGEVGDATELCRTSLTVFLGGAGMSGDYKAEFVMLLEEAGICRPVAGNYAGMWGIADEKGIFDMLADAVSVPFSNSPWSAMENPMRDRVGVPNSTNEWLNMELERALGLSDTEDRLDYRARSQTKSDYTLQSANIGLPAPRAEDRFNIIGYSWGAIVAARMALFYASVGVEVDFLGLVGAPVNASLLSKVRTNGLIKTVSVQNLFAQGDPIFSGMDDAMILVTAPILIGQMFPATEARGHFYYSGSGSQASMQRKRSLIAALMQDGLA